MPRLTFTATDDEGLRLDALAARLNISTAALLEEFFRAGLRDAEAERDADEQPGRTFPPERVSGDLKDGIPF